LLSAKQEQGLARRARGEDVTVPPPGDARPSPEAALSRLVESNLRLVISVARRYATRRVPLEDLVQEGVIGLRRGAEKYDPDLGWRFSTYATWWIRQAVTRAVDRDARLVRLPRHAAERAWRLHRAEEQLLALTGRSPTDAELADHLGMELAAVASIRAEMVEVVSLDTRLGEDGDRTLGDLLADSAPRADELSEAEALGKDVRSALAALPSREGSVLVMRFGLGGEAPLTLEEVGRRLGVTRQRIRQIEARGLRRLRYESSLCRRLADVVT
jgi:RNA polymerase primary sigma factor